MNALKDGFTLDKEKEHEQKENERLKRINYKKAIDEFARREWWRKNWWILVILTPAFIQVAVRIILLIKHPEWLHGQY